MDPIRFDSLTRALSNSRPRRGLLSGVLGAALAGMLVTTEAAADRTRGTALKTPKRRQSRVAAQQGSHDECTAKCIADHERGPARGACIASCPNSMTCVPDQDPCPVGCAAGERCPACCSSFCFTGIYCTSAAPCCAPPA